MLKNIKILILCLSLVISITGCQTKETTEKTKKDKPTLYNTEDITIDKIKDYKKMSISETRDSKLQKFGDAKNNIIFDDLGIKLTAKSIYLRKYKDINKKDQIVLELEAKNDLKKFRHKNKYVKTITIVPKLSSVNNFMFPLNNLTFKPEEKKIMWTICDYYDFNKMGINFKPENISDVLFKLHLTWKSRFNYTDENLLQSYEENLDNKVVRFYDIPIESTFKDKKELTKYTKDNWINSNRYIDEVKDVSITILNIEEDFCSFILENRNNSSLFANISIDNIKINNKETDFKIENLAISTNGKQIFTIQNPEGTTITELIFLTNIKFYDDLNKNKIIEEEILPIKIKKDYYNHLDLFVN